MSESVYGKQLSFWKRKYIMTGGSFGEAWPVCQEHDQDH